MNNYYQRNRERILAQKRERYDEEREMRQHDLQFTRPPKSIVLPPEHLRIEKEGKVPHLKTSS